MKTVLASGALAALVVSVVTAGDGGRDQKFFQGTWKVIHMEEGGDKAADDLIKTLAVHIAGDRITVKDKNKVVMEASFKLDPSKKPKSVDFTFLDGADKGKTELGIYAFEGDKIRFCVNAPGKNRPTAFASPKGTEIGLIVLQRS